MQHLTNLFKLAEITRDQVQYGYNLAGIRKHELSNLAEHHYLVSFIGWQLARLYIKAGGDVNVERVMEICMVHDLGELMGGDINSFYAKAKPKARELAKSFEKENNEFISSFFGEDKGYYDDLIEEMTNLGTNEAIIAKVADYVEVLCYKHRINSLLEADGLFADKIINIAEKLTHQEGKKVILSFLKSWKETLKNDYKGILDLFNEEST